MEAHRIRHPEVAPTPRRVILDANALLIPAQFKVDLLRQLEEALECRVKPTILTATLREVQELARSPHVKVARQATLALKLAEICEVLDIEGREGEDPDQVIIRAALEAGCPVATNDRGLRRRLRSLRVPVIYLRQGRRLGIVR